MPVDVDLAPANPASADIHADWSFEMAGINGPRRLEAIRTPASWALKQILVNGIDATDRALSFGRRDQSLTDVEVVFTDRISELAGTVVDERGRPAPGASVIVFSTNRDRWYSASRFLRTAIAGTDGQFTVGGLPFGSYYAAAIARRPPEGGDAWQDPAFLDALAPGASTVTLREGQKTAVSLRVGR